MAKAKKKTEAKKVAEKDKVVVFKANRPLTEIQFNLLSDLIKQEEKKTGVKIVLMPYSCDVVEND